METEDTSPRPRHPPPRSFGELPPTEINLDSAKYAACSHAQPRLDAYDYNEDRNSPRWKDEDAFFEWLQAADIPKALAEMLYYHCPEVSFLLGSGHIHGVERIIRQNQLGEGHRKAGLFIVASRPNGDPVAIDLLAPNAGEVGYLPHESLWSSSSAELRSLFIPVCSSIGEFFKSFGDEKDTELPSDYYDAKKKRNRA